MEISIELNNDLKNTYGGLEVMLHHEKYKKPIRCGKKLMGGALKKINANNSNLIFNCMGKGKFKHDGIEAGKIEIFKKSKKGNMCMDLREVKIFTNKDSVVGAKPAMPTSNDKAQNTASETASNCVDLKNVDEQSGIVVRGEWNHDEGGYQFNAFGFMPHNGPSTDWSVAVSFNNPVNDVQIWTAKATQIDDKGLKWRFTATEHNAVLHGAKFNFNFLGRSDQSETVIKVQFCSSKFIDGQKPVPGPSKPILKPSMKPMTNKPTPKPWKPSSKPVVKVG